MDLKVRTKISLQRNNVKHSLNPIQEETVVLFMIQPWQRKVKMWLRHLRDVQEQTMGNMSEITVRETSEFFQTR